MSQVTGYILNIGEDRSFAFHARIEDNFAEPVHEFVHSRQVPLICFISTESGFITHIGIGKRGFRAGTDLRRLNVYEIFELNKPLVSIEIAKEVDPKIRPHLINRINYGGLMSKKSFEQFLKIFLQKAPETTSILSKYAESRQLRIERLSKSAKKSLAEQKEAVLTAMNIAGIDRKYAQGWDYSKPDNYLSYLDGITQVELREDSMIINDLQNLPGFNLVRTTKYSSAVFENEKTRLTVLLTNRLPLEELLGTDLIYFNEDFKCFVMVQYKVMEKENNRFIFRLPNLQFSEEINRMESILSTFKCKTGNGHADDFRMSENPFFIKICPRLDFEPDNVGLSSGMYVPHDYIKILQNEETIKGKRNGKAISYNNIGRYFDNTAFKMIIEGGWIGTNQNQSLFIEEIIKDILENGKTAVLAFKKKIEISHQVEDDDYLDFEGMP